MYRHNTGTDIPSDVLLFECDEFASGEKTFPLDFEQLSRNTEPELGAVGGIEEPETGLDSDSGNFDGFFLYYWIGFAVSMAGLQG